MRNLLESAEKGNARAKLAIDIFCYRITKYIGGYIAVLGQLDAIVFTAGIGENNPEVRAKICLPLASLGIELNEQQNRMTVGKEGEISEKDSKVKVFVIPTNEETAIAGETYELTR